MFQTFDIIDIRDILTLPCLVRISIVHFPKTVTWTLFPSVTSVLTEVSRLENRFKLPVIWLLHPESKYHMSCGISWTTLHSSGDVDAINIAPVEVLVLVDWLGLCLPFYVGNYPQWKQAVTCHWHFCYQLVAWTLVFDHTVFIFHVDSVAFL